jgi:hypothetical protein
LKDCVSPGWGRISAWSGVKKSARPLIEGRSLARSQSAAQQCGILPIEGLAAAERGSGIWPLEAPQKEPGYRAKSRKKVDISERNGGTDAYPALLQGHQNR